jgi:hypothetical protein
MGNNKLYERIINCLCGLWYDCGPRPRPNPLRSINRPSPQGLKLPQASRSRPEYPEPLRGVISRRQSGVAPARGKFYCKQGVLVCSTPPPDCPPCLDLCMHAASVPCSGRVLTISASSVDVLDRALQNPAIFKEEWNPGRPSTRTDVL